MTVLSMLGSRPAVRTPDHEVVRLALQRAMQRPLDSQRDEELVRQVSREVNQGEDVVAAQLAKERLRVAAEMVDRVRQRALREGLAPTQLQRLSKLAGVQAIALATRDALVRAQAGQHVRLQGRRPLALVFAAEQQRALADRYEQSDEELAHDFEEAVNELANERQRA